MAKKGKRPEVLRVFEVIPIPNTESFPSYKKMKDSARSWESGLEIVARWQALELSKLIETREAEGYFLAERNYITGVPGSFPLLVEFSVKDGDDAYELALKRRAEASGGKAIKLKGKLKSVDEPESELEVESEPEEDEDEPMVTARFDEVEPEPEPEDDSWKDIEIVRGDS